MKIKIIVLVLSCLAISCQSKNTSTNKEAVAQIVIQAYQDLDSATLVKYTPLQFQETIGEDLNYRKANNNYNKTFEILRDTLLSINNMYYVEAQFSNGDKEVYTFVMGKKTKEWFVNPAALDNPFKRADILKSYKGLKKKAKKIKL